LPRFRSQIEKERALAGEDEEAEKVVGRFEGGEGGVPNYYKAVEIKYSKFGVDDFDFGFVPYLESKLILDSIIPHLFRGWRRTLPTRTLTPCCKSTTSHRQSDYTLLLIPLRVVGSHYVLYANSDLYFKI